MFGGENVTWVGIVEQNATFIIRDEEPVSRSLM